MGVWDAVKSGTLIKRSRVMKKWEPRWFILQAQPAVLFYFKTQNDITPLGEIVLSDCEVHYNSKNLIIHTLIILPHTMILFHLIFFTRVNTVNFL